MLAYWLLMDCAKSGPDTEAAPRAADVTVRALMLAFWKPAKGAYRAVLKLPTLESTVLANAVLLSEAVWAKRVPLRDAV